MLRQLVGRSCLAFSVDESMVERKCYTTQTQMDLKNRESKEGTPSLHKQLQSLVAFYDRPAGRFKYSTSNEARENYSPVVNFDVIFMSHHRARSKHEKLEWIHHRHLLCADCSRADLKVFDFDTCVITAWVLSPVTALHIST